jgi:hypothetical protein
MTRTVEQKLIDRQYRAVAHAHVFALSRAGLLATNFGWSAGPDYCLSKCADINGAQYFLKTERFNRRYTSVILDGHTRLPIASAA